MNTTLLLMCALALGQPTSDASAPPEFAGTFSVLVKTTTLADAAAVNRETDIPSTVSMTSSSLSDSSEPILPAPPHDPPSISEVTPATYVERESEPSLDAAHVPQAAPAMEPIDPGALGGHDGGTIARSDAFAGHPLHLRDALAGTLDRHLQLRIISAYWSLSAAMGRFQTMSEQHERLARWPEPADAGPAARLHAARTAVAAAMREAEVTIVAMQHDLAELVPHHSPTGLVYPADPPYVGAYQTHFESLFTNRPAPAGLFRLHAILPLRLAAIEGRAVAAKAAEEAVMLVEEAAVEGDADADQFVRGLAAWQTQREGHLVAVRDYNIDIAAYALAVAAPTASPDTLISMLLATVPRSTTVPVASGAAAPLANRAAGQVADNRFVADGQSVPTLAAGRPPWQTAASPQTPASASPASVSAVAVPAVVVPPTSAPQPAVPAENLAPNGVTESLQNRTSGGETPGDAPALLNVEQTEAAPFRDVTPAAPARPEVLVPTRPGR